MDPQLVNIRKSEEEIDEDDFNNNNYTTGEVWTVYGDIKALSPDTSGYDSAMKFRDKMKEDLLKSFRINTTVPSANQQSGYALKIRMSPTYDAIGEYRILFGEESLVDFCSMILKSFIKFKGRLQSKLPSGVMIPDKDSFKIKLKWGDYEPITEDVKMKMATNAMVLKNARLITHEVAARYIAPHFGVPDVEEMIKELTEKFGDEIYQLDDITEEDSLQLHGRKKKETEESNKKQVSKSEIKPDEKQR